MNALVLSMIALRTPDYELVNAITGENRRLRIRKHEFPKTR
jgi:hypothetical protein